MKTIALFCDGTWQWFDQPFPTNVAKLARCTMPVASLTPGSPVQVVYYDDGVGVGAGVANDLVRLAGGAFGKGLDSKIVQAYRFVCLNFTPGDRIFVFGFSRGAYTARSLVGLMRHYWVLRRDQLDRIDEVMRGYRSGVADPAVLAAYRSAHCWPSPPTSQPGVTYLGVWDTVGSLGIPDNLLLANVVDRQYQFHDLALTDFVGAARHAVSIDEHRKTFSPSLWGNLPELNAARPARPDRGPLYQQVWFPGGHGSVGGGGDDKGISVAPLLWLAEGAAGAGLLIDPNLLQGFAAVRDDLADFPPKDWTIGELILGSIGDAPRLPGPSTIAEVSESARRRWEGRADYRPQALRSLLGGAANG